MDTQQLSSKLELWFEPSSPCRLNSEPKSSLDVSTEENRAKKSHKKKKRPNVKGIQIICKVSTDYLHKHGIVQSEEKARQRMDDIGVAFLKQVLQNASTYAQHENRKMINDEDICRALQKMGKGYYGPVLK